MNILVFAENSTNLIFARFTRIFIHFDKGLPFCLDNKNEKAGLLILPFCL